MRRIFQHLIVITCCLSNHSIASPDNKLDIIAGEKIYTQCIGCHAPKYHRTGPKHCNLLGRNAGTITEFEFTTAMKNSDIIWTKETLDQFLKAPLKMFPGTSMGIFGITSKQERTLLIEFLTTLTDKNPLCR